VLRKGQLQQGSETDQWLPFLGVFLLISLQYVFPMGST
jgi:hypothetical protein